MTEADTVETASNPAPEPPTEPAADPAAPAPAATGARPGFLRRVWNWHLCRPRMEEARLAAKRTPREEALLRRAKSALAAANHLLEAPERTGQGLAGAHAAVLYLESLYWSLRSWKADLEGPAPELEAMWAEAGAIVDELRLTPEQTAELKRLAAMQKPALELAELAEREQEAAALTLRRASTGVLEVREKPKRVVEALALKSLLRFALTFAVLVALVVGAIAVLPAKKNLAAGKPWTTSSKMFDCNPEAGECGGAQTMIFFHTKEEQNPWLEYDLGTKTQFSSMTIKNRQDGERDRAVPLVVEVSDDGKTFREVIRRTDQFSVWKPSFAKQTARYVRLRVPRKSMLHLESVQIHP